MGICLKVCDVQAWMNPNKAYWPGWIKCLRTKCIYFRPGPLFFLPETAVCCPLGSLIPIPDKSWRNNLPGAGFENCCIFHMKNQDP